MGFQAWQAIVIMKCEGLGVESWNTGHQPPTTGQKLCTVISGSTRKFQAERCASNVRHYYICERARNQPLKCNADQQYEQIDGDCYRIVGARRTYFDARRDCQRHNGDLAPVLSQANENTLYQFALNYKQPVWSGLKTYQGAGSSSYVFHWANGPVLQGPTFWAPHQPAVNSHQKNNTCVTVDASNANMKTWKTHTCTSHYAYVCKMPQGTCGPGWKQHQTSCFLVKPQKLSFAAALKFCSNMGSSLTEVVDSSTNSFLQGLLHDLHAAHIQNFWIGLTDKNSLSGPYHWGITTPVKFANWARSPPANTPGKQDCGYINTGDSRARWSTGGCDVRRSFICETTVFNVPSLNPTTPAPNVCDIGWHLHGSSCYQVNDHDTDWLTARTACKHAAGDLVKITNNDQQSFINSIMHHADYWIGLNDRKQHGKWVWLDEPSKSTFFHWSPHEPNNAGNEYCVAIFNTRNSAQNGHWNDYNCGRSFHSICQKPAVPITCDSGWHLHGTSCYQIHEQSVNWQTARTGCKQGGGDLARITSNDQQVFINGLIGQGHADYWIGLNDQRQHGKWVWLDDQTSPVYYHWSPHEPNNAGNEYCVAIYNTRDTTQNGHWNDYNCGKSFHYVCQKQALNAPTTAKPLTTKMWSPKCGPLWEDDPNTAYCYQFRDDQLTWLGARAFCKRMHGDLVSVTSLQEQGYITAKISGMLSTLFWIGANDKHQENKWGWIDGAPMPYLHWKPGEPNNMNNKEDCAVMTKNTAQWIDTNCGDRHGFICKKKGIATSTVHSTVTRRPPAGMILGCDYGWMFYKGSCYRILKQKMTWADGQSRCHGMHAELASISDASVMNFIFSKIVHDHSLSHGVWIGLNDQLKDMVFVWTDGSSVTYTNWARGEPNNARRREDCVGVYTPSGKWNDYYCGTSLPGTVCKKTAHFVSKTTPSSQSGCAAYRYSIAYGPFCYKFFTQSKRTWSDAEKQCQRMHGHLVTINDGITQAFLSSDLAVKTQYKYFWIGLSNQQSASTYSWTIGVVPHYTDWSGQHTGNEVNTCVAAETGRPVGLWVNFNCTDTHYTLCEFPRKGYTTPMSTTPQATGSCSPGWKVNNGNCYKIVIYRKSWPEARAVCQGYGGDLVSIHSSQENSYVQMYLINAWAGSGFWIGLNDRNREAAYEWSDGTPNLFTHWNKGEPNNVNDQEDCTEMVAGDAVWNDDSCSTPRRFVCKMRQGLTVPATVHTTPITPVKSAQCGSDSSWSFYKGACYWVSKHSFNWYDARDDCLNKSSYLTSVHSRTENQLIVNMITNSDYWSYWMGLNELGLSTYVWPDNSAMDFTNWSPSEPNDAYGGEKCVEIVASTAQWNDNNCGDQKPYICKKQVGAVVTPKPIVATGGCPPGFHAFGSKCFSVGGQSAVDKVNWTAAVKRCTDHGSKFTLASIHSPMENDFVMTLLKGTETSFFLGFNDIGIEAHFIWQDNTVNDYTNWSPGEPNEHRASGGLHHFFNLLQKRQNEDCVEISGYTANFPGRWNDVSCSALRGYICQTYKDPAFSVHTTADPQHPGYSQYGTSHYKLVSGSYFQAEAITQCRSDGGNLVSISDQFEQAFVHSLMQSTKSSAWIGLQSTMSLLYSWIDGWPVTYTRWAKGEPSGELHSGGCVIMNVDGTWNATVCSLTTGYVCEINTNKPPQTTPFVPGQCYNSQWIVNGDYCYFVPPGQLKSQSQASATCRQMGMTIASIHSEAEKLAVLNVIKTERSNITSSLHPLVHSVWIGLIQGSTGGFVWEDRSPVNYQNWDANEPSDKSGTENCVEMYATSGKWNDVDCSSAILFVCKAPIVPIIKGSTSKTSKTTPKTSATTPSRKTTPHKTPPHKQSSQTRSTLTKPVKTNGPVTPAVTQKVVTSKIHYQPQRTNNNKGTSGLSSGGVAGILIAGILILVIVIGGMFVAKQRKVWIFDGRRTSGTGPGVGGFDNAAYSISENKVVIKNKEKETYGISGADGDSADC